MWDDEGRELIDANNNFTTLIHGNANPEVLEAANAVMRGGTCWGVPNAEEWELAELLLQRMPGYDQIRFANSGTEAVMSAFRIARAFTGRDRIVMTKDGFHGTSDTALSASGPSRGVPASATRDVSLVPLNDVAALRETFASVGSETAAIILDLLPNKAGLTPVDDEFLREARALATQSGALLIVDEIISYRLATDGLDGARDAQADLVTLGKVIGGGFPIGAVVGKAEVMSVIDPWQPGAINHSGTFSGNPVTMAAGAAAMRLLTAEAIERINGLGDRARAALTTRLAPLGWEVRGSGSLLRPFPAGIRKVDEATQHRLWWEAYGHGVVLSSANLAALSTPMTSDVVDDFVERLASAVQAVASSNS